VAWWEYAVLGASGGAIVEVLTVFKCVTRWQAGRRNKDGTLKVRRPGWRKYVDLPLLAWLLAIRMPLGAGAATLFGMTGQIVGAYASIAFGFAAPAMLAQLGSIPQIANAVQGGDPTPDTPSHAEIAPMSRAE
jgi:hypothetical protein